MKKLVNNKTGVSQRKIANCLKISQSTVSDNIKKLGLKYRKRYRAPKATESKKKSRQRDFKNFPMALCLAGMMIEISI